MLLQYGYILYIKPKQIVTVKDKRSNVIVNVGIFSIGYPDTKSNNVI